MQKKRWILPTTTRSEAEALARQAGISAVTARLLLNRGVRDAAGVRGFLRPDLHSMIPPQKFPDMAKAVDRIRTALRNGEKIGIFGDYDVDGTCGSAILVRFLRLIGREPETYIPHRVDEGYGLSREGVERFAAIGVRVMITVDCGTASVSEIARARELGMDTVIVDHHEPKAGLPPAVAILNPKIPGSTYPFTGLCSSGISFKLMWALSEGMGASSSLGAAYQDFIFDALGLAALGTIADVCPLTGENRIFVSYGLEALRRTKVPGLRALLKQTRLGEKKIDGFDVAFRIAPRLNAVGRLGRAAETLELLTSDSEARVAEIVEKMETANEERREIESGISKQAFEQVRNQLDLTRDRVIVVADSRWHFGVVGIVAARLVEGFQRPSFVLSVDGDLARGSGRSIEGFALHEALESCSGLLRTHGGHAMAAGVSLSKANLGAFRKGMNEFASRVLKEEDLVPALRLDDEIRLEELTESVVREIAMLGPHGPGNPPPLFAAKDARVAGSPRLMGKKSDHLSFYASHNGPALRAVGFGLGGMFESLSAAARCSMAFTPEINEWQGRESVELKIKDLQIP